MHEIAIGADILAANNAAAQHNRRHFAESRLYVLNLMSGPGAGKTTLLVKTIERLKDRYRIGVIEGDVQTRRDADRIARAGVPVIQINTGGACHLSAAQIHEGLEHFQLEELDLLIIENVGNLVCPAEFDLGEHDKVMLLSVTEGDDKPQKYPVMFLAARAMVLTKVDLLPHVDFDCQRAKRDARSINLDLEVLPVSAQTGHGLAEWCEWLSGRVAQLQAHSDPQRRSSRGGQSG